MTNTVCNKNLLVDGKKIGDVLEFHITWADTNEETGEEAKRATIRYTVGGKERVLTCEAEAISFES